MKLGRRVLRIMGSVGLKKYPFNAHQVLSQRSYYRSGKSAVIGIGVGIGKGFCTLYDRIGDLGIVHSNCRIERFLKMDSDGAKLFVGGISRDTTEDILKFHFCKYGVVLDSTITIDRVTRSPRGFGFVTLSDISAADKALHDTHVILGRTVSFSFSFHLSFCPICFTNNFQRKFIFKFKLSEILVNSVIFL